MDDNNPFSNVVWWFKTRDTGELAFIGILALIAVILAFLLLSNRGGSDDANALAGDIATGQVTQAPTVDPVPTPTTIVIPTPMATATPKLSAEDLVSGTDNADKVKEGDATPEPTTKPKKPKDPKPASNSNSGGTAAGNGSSAAGSGSSGSTASSGGSGSTASSGNTASAGNTSSGNTASAGNSGGTTSGGGGSTGTTSNNSNTSGSTSNTTDTTSTQTTDSGGGDSTGTTTSGNVQVVEDATPAPTAEQVWPDAPDSVSDYGLSHETCEGVITFGGLCNDRDRYDNVVSGSAGDNSDDTNSGGDNTTTATPAATPAATSAPSPTVEPQPADNFGASADSQCLNGYRTVDLRLVNTSEETATFIVSYQISNGTTGSDAFSLEPSEFTTGSITGVNPGATLIEVTVNDTVVQTQSFPACA